MRRIWLFWCTMVPSARSVLSVRPSRSSIWSSSSLPRPLARHFSRPRPLSSSARFESSFCSTSAVRLP
uniref:Putative secreted protein n=1 Tax=Ixodes ricinus TaxID=34613 RepID=A0A6B0TQQ3_IXORI